MLALHHKFVSALVNMIVVEITRLVLKLLHVVLIFTRNFLKLERRVAAVIANAKNVLIVLLLMRVAVFALLLLVNLEEFRGRLIARLLNQQL